MARLLMLATLMAALLAPSAAAEQRIALVIGNAAYATAPLANPVNDARLIGAALRAQGFEVIERLDVGRVELQRAVKDFGNRLKAADSQAIGLLYYAGHGMQIRGENFLVPIDAEIEDEGDVEIYAVSANAILRTIADARNGLNIVILDACRNNPFAQGFRATTRGLAMMDAPTGTLIAYSTAPGEVSLDGEDANSPYSQALARAIAEPGLPVEQMFKTVRDAVLAATLGRQTPWEASSLTGADFYMAAAPPATAEPSAAAVPAPAVDDRALDLAFWDSIKDSDDAAVFAAYLEQFPDGTFAALARLRIEQLTATAVAARAPSTEPVPATVAVEPWDAALVALRNSNIRAGPSTETDTVGALVAGDQVTVTGKAAGLDWYRVALADGGEGYVWAPLLGEATPTQAEDADPVSIGTRYQDAMRLMARDSGGAEAALQEIVDSAPDHELAGRAYFWLGEIAMRRHDYGRAATAFARGYVAFPNGKKASESLQKLGTALAAMNKRGEACPTLERLRRELAAAPARLGNRLRQEWRRAGCG